MKLSELISTIGDKNIQFQRLEADFIKGETKRDDGEITFATDKNTVINYNSSIAFGNKPDKVGLILWINREKMPESLKNL